MNYKMYDLFAIRRPLLTKNYKNFLNITDKTKYIEFLNNCLKNEEIIEAIFICSYSFYKALEKINFDLNNLNLEKEKSNKVIETLSNYINRFSFRATPFGVSSSVGYCNMNNRYKEKKLKKRFISIDIEWLYKVKNIIESDENNFLKLKVTWNTLAIISGNKVKLLDTFDKGIKTIIKTIDYNEIIKYIINNYCNKSINICTLIKEIIEKFPDIKRKELLKYLYKLKIEEFLITNLSIDLTNKNILTEFMDNLKLINEEWYFKLKEINFEFNKYMNMTSNYIKQLKLIRMKMSKIIKSDNYYKIDCKIYNTEFILDKKEVKEIKEALEFLICVQGNLKLRNLTLKRYIDRFIEFYGIETEVKLLDLLDSSKGLGNPYNHNEYNDEELLPLDIDKEVLNLILQSIKKNKKSLDLSKVKLRKMCDVNLNEFEFVFRKNSSNFEILNLKYTDKIGKMMGRFNPMFEETVCDKLQDFKTVEIVENLRNKKLQNLATVGDIKNKRIYLGIMPKFERMCDLTKISVGLKKVDKEYSFYFKNIETLEIIKFDITNNLNYNKKSIFSYISKFLIDSSKNFQYSPRTFYRKIKMIYSFPYIPELRYKSIILQPELWIFNINYEKSNLKDILESFLKFKKEWKMPNKIIYHDFDLELYLNLKNKIHLEILLKKFMKAKGEFIFSRINDSTENNYNDEYVSFVKKDDIHEKGNNIIKINKYVNNIYYTLGEEWIYIKFYGVEDRMEEFLKVKLLAFVEKIKFNYPDSLFHYLVYNDGIKHIRFRIRTRFIKDVYSMLYKFVELIKKEGYVNRVIVDTYYPEIQKYGNVNVMDKIHRLFDVDSYNTLNYLKNNLDRYVIAIKYIFTLFSNLGYNYYGICNIFNNFETSKDEKKQYIEFKNKNKNIVFSIYKEFKLDILEKNLDNELKLIMEELDKKTKLNIVFNVIHMYLNRLLLSKKDEEKIYSFMKFMLEDLKYFIEGKNGK